MLNSGKRMFRYAMESSQSDSCGHQCFSSSSIGDSQQKASDLIHGSSLGIPGSAFHSQAPSGAYHRWAAEARPSVAAENPFGSCFDSSVNSNLSPQSTTQSVSGNQLLENETDFDEDVIKLKLQELESALLNDNDDDGMATFDQDMSIDENWSFIVPPAKESSPESSLISGIGGTCKERSPKELLFECAAAVSESNMEEASAMIAELRQLVSIQGDPPQRLAAYMVEGLAARMACSGQGLYKALKCKEPPTSDQLSAMQILFEVCPCFKFGFMTANCVIIEACKDDEMVHIVDFDINQGSQYFTLIHALSTRRGKPPRLRVTGVDDPDSVQRAVGGLKVIGQRLEQLALEVGVPFEFRAIAAKTSDVVPQMLDCRPGESLFVNFAFQLHHMPDESVSTANQRDTLLRMVKSLNPKLVTVVEQDVNTNTAPFFPRFVEVYNYYYAVFKSLDATMPRESTDRMNVERQCLARDIVNIVACEGVERIERYEAAGKWRARMTMAGFASCPLSGYVSGTIRALLKGYCNRYKVKEEADTLYFGWEDKILVVASAWK